jgi:2-dehydropantoate 2-reductase
MNICIFGVGGVGGYFGTLITRRFFGEHAIYFIARGNHKEAIIKNGLILKKESGEEVITVHPTSCTDTTSGIPVCDSIILSVKSYDLPGAVETIRPITGEHTVILPLLNGVDIYDRIRAILPTGIVLPACVYVGTHIEQPGVIFQKGGNCRICLGADPNHPDSIPEELLSLLRESNIHFSLEEDVRIAIWSKFIFIAAYGLMTAAYDVPLGGILENALLSTTTLSIMTEITTIARKLNIPLPQESAAAAFEKAKLFPYDTKTSFQRDIEAKGSINEGDLFGGTIIRFGKELSVPVPATESVYTRLMDSCAR